jgi:hypothetical protein
MVGDYTTGNGVSHSTAIIKQLFVMVKDTDNRSRDNSAWGNILAAGYKTDCLGCHVPAKENDWVYTEAFPILINHSRLFIR